MIAEDNCIMRMHYKENGPRLFYIFYIIFLVIQVKFLTIKFSVISLSLRKCRWSSPTSRLPTPSIQQRPIPRPASPCPRQPATVTSAVAATPPPSRRRSPRTGMSFIPPCLRRQCCTCISRSPVAGLCFRTLPRGAAHASAAARWPALFSGICQEEEMFF